LAPCLSIVVLYLRRADQGRFVMAKGERAVQHAEASVDTATI